MKQVYCYHCERPLSEEEVIFQVRVVHDNGAKTLEACCSQACAEAVRQACMAVHLERYESAKNQIFQRMVLHTFIKNQT